MTFACTLLFHKCLLFILVCCCSVLFVSKSYISSKRYLRLRYSGFEIDSIEFGLFHSDMERFENLQFLFVILLF